MDLDAAMELDCVARRVECFADCMAYAALPAAVDWAVEGVRRSCVLVSLVAVAAIVRSVPGVSGMNLDMEEGESIVAAENVG